MDENIIEEWMVVDRWWTDNPIKREYKVLVDETTWTRELIEEHSDTWSEWTKVAEE